MTGKSRNSRRACCRSEHDVVFDFSLGSLDAVGLALDLENRLRITRRCHDIRVGRLLDEFNGRAFRADDQADDLIGHGDFFRDLMSCRRGGGVGR